MQKKKNPKILVERRCDDCGKMCLCFGLYQNPVSYCQMACCCSVLFSFYDLGLSHCLLGFPFHSRVKCRLKCRCILPRMAFVLYETYGNMTRENTWQYETGCCVCFVNIWQYETGCCVCFVSIWQYETGCCVLQKRGQLIVIALNACMS